MSVGIFKIAHSLVWLVMVDQACIYLTLNTTSAYAWFICVVTQQTAVPNPFDIEVFNSNCTETRLYVLSLSAPKYSSASENRG